MRLGKAIVSELDTLLPFLTLVVQESVGLNKAHLSLFVDLIRFLRIYLSFSSLSCALPVHLGCLADKMMPQFLIWCRVETPTQNIF